MHGLINRAIQCFVADTYGDDRWAAAAQSAGISVEGFEPMLDYDDSVTDSLLDTVSQLLDKPDSVILEDLGTYLVSHETMRGIRRLLRFCGVNFVDFLHELEDLPARARLALPDLQLPDLELRAEAEGRYRLFVLSERRGWGDVMVGLLRAMADDYGALVLLEMAPGASAIAVIDIRLLDQSHSEGRSFSLAGQGFGLTVAHGRSPAGGAA